MSVIKKILTALACFYLSPDKDEGPPEKYSEKARNRLLREYSHIALWQRFF